MGYIYKITNNINQKPYIGKTVDSIQERWREHIYEAFSHHSYFLIHQAMRKYGLDNFTIVELEQCSNDMLSEREQYWIKTINTHFEEGYGYNMTHGGDGTLRYSDKQILELWNKGFSSGEIAKILGATPSTISIRLKSLVGEGAARQRRTEKNRKPVLQYDLSGNFIKAWNSVSEAEKGTNTSSGSITRCCKKERVMASNSLWKYATDETPIEELMINYAKSQKCNGVDLIDKDGNVLEQFKTAAEAERQKGITRGKISEICNHKKGRKTGNGLYWQWSYPLKRQLIEDGNDS